MSFYMSIRLLTYFCECFTIATIHDSVTKFNRCVVEAKLSPKCNLGFFL